MYQSKYKAKLVSNMVALLFLAFQPALLYSQIYLNPSAPIEERVSDLLCRMTLNEKIGQMIQAERGSVNIRNSIAEYFLGSILSGGGSTPAGNTPTDWIGMYNGMQDAALSTRLKIPIIYGIDAVHGNNNVFGATIFPHNIGLGCTRDTLIVEKCAEATAVEVKAIGLNWTFSPCIAVPRNIRWGRTYEGFGETPELQQIMARAAVLGYQGDSLGTPDRIVACAKHFIGDGGTNKGVNQGNTQLSEEELRKIHLPGYIAAIKAGVGSVMISFNSWNGTYCHGNKYLITDLLKNELGFNGLVVSDWNGIHYLSSNYKECVRLSVNAGIDLFMETESFADFYTELKSLVEEGSVPMSRIDDAVRRILRVKFKMGLFEHPYATTEYVDSLGKLSHRTIAREAVRKSLVLLKNEGSILPLSKKSGIILVAGSKADNIGCQCGGLTINWQGGTGNITVGTSILEAIKSVRGSDNVFYSSTGITSQNAEIAVVVVGETPYAEGAGDNSNPSLSSSDLAVISAIQKKGIPYVILLISGRPLMTSEVIDKSNAFVACWLPGTEGLGISDVLFGDYDFTGKLSQTWPRTIAQEPINMDDSLYNPLFAYGFGLTYRETVENETIKSSASFFPNPVKDYMVIKLNGRSKVEISNILGEQKKILYSSDDQVGIVTSELSNGIYFLIVTNEKGIAMIQKFVKN
jgi:beta-glucosidase